MCGRYTDTRRDKEFLTRAGVQEQAEFLPRYNLAPTQDAWVVTRGEDGTTRMRKMRWGLVPFWAKDVAIGNKLINARSESATERPAFRRAFQQRRCLVLADGFYEWRKTPKGKVPYYIRLKNGQPFVFAGLWETWQGMDDRTLESFCILTGGANELVAEIHDRMPIILKEEDALNWLDPRAQPGQLKAMLHPFAAERMETYPVSKRVNRPENEGPECAARAEEPTPTEPDLIQLSLI